MRKHVHHASVILQLGRGYSQHLKGSFLDDGTDNRRPNLPTYHQGISPALVSMLTGKDESLLPPRLTISMVPGRYVTKIARNKALVAPQHPVNKHMLECGQCGRQGQYDLGYIAFSLPKHEERNWAADSGGMQCTGFFRCKHCNAAGDWRVSSTFSMFQFSAAMAELTGSRSASMGFARIHLFDGTEPKWATDAEGHLLGKLRSEGPDAYIWDRLGNLYLSGNRPELAMAAFERAVELDSAQLESQYSIGDLLYQIQEPVAAAHHLRLALANARFYDKLDKTHLRNMMAVTLKNLMVMHLANPDIAFVPTEEEYGDTVPPSREGPLQFKQFPLDLDVAESFYPLADLYMGSQHTAPAADNTLRAISTKIGRNDPCPCRSGKKYKKCCGR